MMNALPCVRPVSELRTHLPEIEAIAQETGEPIILTKNGAAKLVVMDNEAFNEHLQHERAVRKLREAEIEARYTKEKPLSLDEVKERISFFLAGTGDGRIAASA